VAPVVAPQSLHLPVDSGVETGQLCSVDSTFKADKDLMIHVLLL